MIGRTTDVSAIPAIEHEAAMRMAATEYDRLLAVVDDLREDEWSRQTDCPGWDVRAMLGHILGMLELQADADERLRQMKIAADEIARTGGVRLDALTALQVREHEHLAIDALRRALHDTAPRGLAARSNAPAEQRAATYDPQLPGETAWTFGYLYDIIFTRDPWIHRVDICRATGRELILTPDHDGRIVAGVVSEWARRHGHDFTLTLRGPAGGTFRSGAAGEEIDLDAVEFCRILSGRATGTGLLTTRVPF